MYICIYMSRHITYHRSTLCACLYARNTSLARVCGCHFDYDAIISEWCDYWIECVCCGANHLMPFVSSFICYMTDSHEYATTCHYSHFPPAPEKIRLEIVIGMEIEILDAQRDQVSFQMSLFKRDL